MDTEQDRDRQRRRMAEFLVHDQLGTELFISCGVRSDTRLNEVRSLLAGTPHSTLYIGVRPNWYYGYERRGGGEQ